MAMAARVRRGIVQAKAVVELNLRRGLCDAPASNIGLVKSEAELKSALKRVREDAVPALFYYTAAWCGPCKLMAPIVERLSRQHPHVATYKVDIDQLLELDVTAVPTFDFYQNGKKVERVVGADEKRLRANMEAL